MNVAAPSRRAEVRRAFALEWVTVGWMFVEGTVALGSGILAHSITLVAFGADSAIELLSAAVLLWRLDIELRKGRAISEVAEKRASRIAGGLLYLLGLYIVLSAFWSLWHRQGEEFSWAGLLVALTAIPLMYVLAKRKIAITEQIGSKALRADAAEAITCGYLSIVVVIGLLAQLWLRAWWVDAATSLAIVYFVVREAHEAWRGEICGCASEEI